MSGEIDGAAEEFERTADWLRNELKSLVVLLRAAEPEAVEEEVQERRTTRGAQGSTAPGHVHRARPRL
ncbi:hypothetical protein ACWD7Y_06410 [Streptomyces drozdowiczii]